MSPMELHLEARLALSQQYGLDIGNRGAAEWSAPHITLTEPAAVERKYGEGVSSLWVQYVKIDPALFESKGLTDPLKPNRPESECEGIWDDYQVGGETLRSHCTGRSRSSEGEFAYCAEDLTTMLEVNKHGEWSTADYRIIQQHKEKLLEFVEQPVGTSHSVSSLVVVPSDRSKWNETVGVHRRASLKAGIV